MPSPIVIVGASLAGATAAVTLRREGFEGGLVLVGAEPHLPYERPPLSKSYLRGESPLEDALVWGEDFYVSLGIDLRVGTRATSLDTERKSIALDDGDTLPYERLLIATGCRERTASVPGADLDGVHALRTVEDCDRLRAEMAPGRTAVVGGMSFVGSEVAASLRALDVGVTGIGSRSHPLQRVFGDDVGRALSRIHEEHGVRLVAEDRVAALEGDGRIEAVITANGLRLPCDFAVMALGVEPDVDLVAGTSILVEDGIVVDEWCRTTANEVYACGDVARFMHPIAGRSMRVEHWHHARTHGRAAARSMLGTGGPYDEIPWFWSEQYEHELQYAGFAGNADDVIVRGTSEASGGLTAFYQREGVLEAVVSLDRGGDVRRAIREIAARRVAEPHT